MKENNHFSLMTKTANYITVKLAPATKKILCVRNFLKHIQHKANNDQFQLSKFAHSCLRPFIQKLNGKLILSLAVSLFFAAGQVYAEEVVNENSLISDTYTVPARGQVTITISGADGGDGKNEAGGSGAEVTGVFDVTGGQIIRYVVGEAGQSSNEKSAGGGGSTGVYIDTTLVLAAGAGGGGNKDDNRGANGIGLGGNTGQNGDDAIGGNGGAGGTGGNGGGAGGRNSDKSGGGGGVNSVGSDGKPGTGGGQSDTDVSDTGILLSIASGGSGTGGGGDGGDGFSGGGGAEKDHSGGAGGYSGGGGADKKGSAGGGGSFIATTATGYVSSSSTAGSDGGGTESDGSDRKSVV